MKRIIFLVVSVYIFQLGFSQKTIEKDFKFCFDKYGIDGCFVLYDQTENEFIKYHSSLCDTGYIPASTFKIPNSIIALEEGIVKDTNQIIKWDGHQWPNENFNHDQTLKTAMRYSCVWVYVKFAEQIGIEKYNKYVKSFDYGNKDLTGPPNWFWLEGKLRISANRQIEFLRKFYNYELPASKRSIDIVKSILVLEQKDNFILSGKTGGGMLNDKDYIMWLVGYVEKDNRTYFYALNFISDDYDKTKQIRYDLTKDILRELKIIE